MRATVRNLDQMNTDRIVSRPKLNVYLLGSEDLGQNILKDCWTDTTVDLKTVLLSTAGQLNIFLIHYSPDKQDSISYACSCVESILSSFPRQTPKVFLIEATNIKQIEENGSNKKVPEAFAQFSMLRTFSIDVHYPVTLTPVFRETIANPLVESLEESHIEQIITDACANGQLELLKLFLTLGRPQNPQKWLKDILVALQSLSCTDKKVTAILATAELIYNLEPKNSKSFVVSQISTFPRSSLMVLARFNNLFNKNPQVLALPHLDLQLLSPLSIAEMRYTHISLPHNCIASVPEELLQLPSLITLNLSNNKLGEIPSIIRWNCPKLQELNLSHNVLVDVPPTLFKSGNQGKRASIYAGVSNETHAAPQRMVLRLTGQNLYPCIHSMMTVDISHNPKLTRVPEWACVLPHLALLNLRGLPKLTILPQELGYWESLSIIQLEAERMISPPANICVQRSQAILAYLRCQLKGSAHYRHMKIMVLGSNMSGKTTIFKGLINSKKATGVTSSAMDIANYDFRGEVNGGQHIKITYHLMDFSHQAMEYVVYQCFLVKRCVYLVVFNVQEGKEGLRKILPSLKTLHSCLPEAHVLLLATHTDKMADVGLSDIFSWIKEVFSIDHPASLHNPQYAHSCGLPVVSRLILLNALEIKDIEGLKQAIHWLAGDMMGYSPQPRTEEMIPRLYTSLQGVIETKLKRNKHQPNILKYEELFDSFKSVSGDLNDEQREFNLACEFLQDTGALVCQSMSGLSDLYFLNLQWLSDTISTSLNSLCKQVGTEVITVSTPILKNVLSSSGVPDSCVKGFLNLLEDKRHIIPLDMEKSYYLLLPLLPTLPPNGYKLCDYSKPNTLVRKMSCKYLPIGLFPYLQSQIITSLYRLGAQLMVISNMKESSRPLDPFNNYSGIDTIKRGKAFTLSSQGYVENKSRKDIEDGGDELKTIRVISFSSPVDAAHQDLAHVKLNSLSEGAFSNSLSFASDSSLSESWISDGTFWQGILWKNGMYMEYRDGTMAWVEGEESEITITTQGSSEIPCIKSLMFLTTCLHSILEDRFPYLQTTSLIPCTNCIMNGSLEKNDKQSVFTTSNILKKFTQQQTPQSLICEKCQTEAKIEKVSPEIALLDFHTQHRLDEGKMKLVQSNENLLGQGRYSKVYSSLYNDKDVAVKVYQYHVDKLVQCFNSLRSELNILTTLSHDHLLSPVGALLRPMTLVLPLAPLGSLQDHIQLCTNGFDDQISHKLLYQIADGLQYLHSLYIIHRDIKPSNVLVWSLDPVNGVHVKISDCGLSQFNTPNGLSRQLGTEDFMAPELFTTGRKLFYNEKVDIFSFGIMLYSIASGKSLVPGSLFKTDSQITNLSLSLGQAITSSMEEQRPHDPVSNTVTSILKDGIHPASRQGLVTMCVAKCLQSLLRDCLWREPSRRPSAEGICSHLLVCTAPSTQERIIIQQNFPIVGSVEVPSVNSIVAWGNHGHQLLLISKEVWNVKTLKFNIPDAVIRTKNVICLAGCSVYIASCKNRSLQSFSLFNFSSIEAPKNALPSNPCCIFSSQNGSQVFVGMEGGRIAMFTASAEGQSPLQSSPLVGRTLDHPDRKKTPVRCGVVVNDVVLCGCGRYLIGLDRQNLQQKFFKPLTDQGTMISGIANSGDTLWVWFSDCGEIIVCDTLTGNRLDSIDIRKCLHDNIPNVSEILITTVAMAHPTVWVGTNTGHVMGFNSKSLELLVAVQHHSIVESIVALEQGTVLMVFGKWKYEGDTVMEGFSVWQSHMCK